jgi:cytochrome c oxidase assembly protein subunit 20
MAGDTRDTDGTQSLQPPNVTSGAAVPPADSMRPKTYETFSPPPNANALPEGSGLNTAGAHSSNPTLSEAVKTLRFEDFKQVYMYPCVRESLLNGIGGGFVMGGLRLIFGCKIHAQADSH